MRGAKICGCAVCGWRGFPHRYWCPACGSLETIDVVVKAGVVEQATTVRRAAGRPGGAPVTIGSVRTDGGALIVVRLEGVAAGDSAGLHTEDGVFVARVMQHATRNVPVAE